MRSVNAFLSQTRNFLLVWPQMSPELSSFALWLDTELKRREWSRSYLAATMGKRAQTVYSWFNDGRVPSTELCRELARVLKIPPELVLVKAGHLAPDTEITTPPVPGWLTDLLEQLTDDELTVVGATARGLLEVRQEKGPTLGPAQYARAARRSSSRAAPLPPRPQ